MNILHPKEVCRVGCWNVRTLYQTRKLAQVLKEIILHRMIDPYLRKEKAGFRKGKLCADHFFSLRLEQRYDGTPHYMPISLTLPKHLIWQYIHCPVLKMILMHYGITNKIIFILQMLHEDFYANVICGTELSYSFPIQTGVRQGYMLSPLLFNLCIYWLMKTTTRQADRGMSWTL